MYCPCHIHSSTDIYCRLNVAFQQTHHLVNAWNENKRVQESRDGQVRHTEGTIEM